MESTSAILRGRYTSHSSLFAQPQHGARTLPSSGMYPRECPFPASYQLPGPCGCALCQLPYPCRTFEQRPTSERPHPPSYVLDLELDEDLALVCIFRGFGTRRGMLGQHAGGRGRRMARSLRRLPPWDAANRLVSPRFAIWQSLGGQVRPRVIDDFSVSLIYQSVDASDANRPESLDGLASLARL